MSVVESRSKQASLFGLLEALSLCSSTTETSKEPERGVKSHPPKRRNSMVSRVHVHQFSASVWRAARSNVASRTYKKKAWNEVVGPALQRPAKSQKGASKATLRNGKTAWCRGFTCTNFRPPFGGLRGQTLRPEPTKKRLGMRLSAQHYQDQHRGRKGRQKPPSETATHNFRPPFGVLRCQTSRPEPTKKRLGMSL